MPETAYRAYMLDENDHILAAVALDAANNQEATTKATALMDGRPIEIWEGSRMVARLPRTE